MTLQCLKKALIALYALTALCATAQWRFSAVFVGDDPKHTSEEMSKADQALEELANSAYEALLDCKYLRIKDPQVRNLLLIPANQMIFYSNKPDMLKNKLGGDYLRYCAVTEPDNHVIFLAPNAGSATCGPLISTLMHEMFHLAGLSHQDLRPAYLFKDFIYTTANRCYNELTTRKAK